MSTTTATQHHFPHALAFAAASAVVVVGGLTAIGVAAYQDNTTASHSPTSTATYNQQCPDPRCMPHAQQQQPSQGYPGPGFGLKGGHPMVSEP
jgi:hypothetical protein